MALDAYKMRLVAKALMVLREKTVAIRLVNQDFQMVAASKNEVISIPDSVAQAVHDVVPSNAYPAKVEVDPDDRLLRLDQWKETYFDAVDKDEVEANLGWFIRQVEQCAKALGNGMDAFVHLLFARYSSLGVGTAGTTPFAASGDELGEFFSGNESLNKGLADESDRYLIVDPAANTNLMKQSAFAAADERGSTITGLTGQLGRKFGYDCFMSQNVQKIVRLTNAGTASAVGAKGATQLPVDALGATGINEGERLLIGSVYYHVVTGVKGSAAGTITLDRPLEVAVADNTTINRFGTRTNNLMFHRDAMTLAMRSPGPPSRGAASAGNFSTHRDPESGIIIQVEVQRLHAMTRYYFRTLYGGTVLHPELAYQIFG